MRIEMIMSGDLVVEAGSYAELHALRGWSDRPDRLLMLNVRDPDGKIVEYFPIGMARAYREKKVEVKG